MILYLLNTRQRKCIYACGYFCQEEILGYVWYQLVFVNSLDLAQPSGFGKS